MIHHQHYFPVVDDQQKLLPAFLAVTNIEVEQPQKIAINAERVLTARLRDARFFWDADRRDAARRQAGAARHPAVPQGARQLRGQGGSGSSAWPADMTAEALGGTPAQADAAATAGRLAKADLTTDMVREFTELQGMMGGIYAARTGSATASGRRSTTSTSRSASRRRRPPTAAQLGEAACPGPRSSVADKIDTLVGLFAAGEQPTGTRDPFALRRAAQGLVKVLVDLPEVAGVEAPACASTPSSTRPAEGYAAQGPVRDVDGQVAGARCLRRRAADVSCSRSAATAPTKSRPCCPRVRRLTGCRRCRCGSAGRAARGPARRPTSNRWRCSSSAPPTSSRTSRRSTPATQDFDGASRHADRAGGTGAGRRPRGAPDRPSPPRSRRPTTAARCWTSPRCDLPSTSSSPTCS